MKTLEQIRNTPVLLLTADEIEQLDPKSQVWARNSQAIAKRERECAHHDPVGTSTSNGWHNLRCNHCGKDMSYDSGD